MKQGLWVLALVLGVVYLLLFPEGELDHQAIKPATFKKDGKQTQEISRNSAASTKLKRSAPDDYSEARQVLWRSLYSDGGKTLYCQQPFSGGNRNGLNVEHVFPMSWVTNSLDCGTRKQCRARSTTFNQIEADLHNLYPSRTDVNSDRSSFRFGEVKGEERRYGNACDFEANQQARVAEPAPAVRGEVARSMFYMAHQYRDQGLTIFAKQAKLLHAWHLADPPTSKERERNKRIKDIQGTANPFIEQPSLLTKLIKQGDFR